MKSESTLAREGEKNGWHVGILGGYHVPERIVITPEILDERSKDHLISLTEGETCAIRDRLQEVGGERTRGLGLTTLKAICSTLFEHLLTRRQGRLWRKVRGHVPYCMPDKSDCRSWIEEMGGNMPSKVPDWGKKVPSWGKERRVK